MQARAAQRMRVPDRDESAIKRSWQVHRHRLPRDLRGKHSRIVPFDETKASAG